MNSVIERLYHGEIYPAQDYKPILRHVREKRDAAFRQADAFRQTLTLEQEHALEALLTQYGIMLDAEMEQTFSDGFRLGCRLMCEVFMQKEVEGLLEAEEAKDEDEEEEF